MDLWCLALKSCRVPSSGNKRRRGGGGMGRDKVRDASDKAMPRFLVPTEEAPRIEVQC